MLEDKLVGYGEFKEKENKKPEIYDKAFFLNEEMNNLKEQLEKFDVKNEKLEE